MAVKTSQRASNGVKRRVTVLGSTGSIGRNTVDILARDRDHYHIVALTGHNNVVLLAQQALRLQPEQAVIGNLNLYPDLCQALAGTGIACATGDDGLYAAASEPCDVIISAIVGIAGLPSTMRAIKAASVVGLANKESLVCAGEIINRACTQHDCQIIPVDSEHSAIFQVFDSERPESVDHITLTASGGPFWHTSLDDMINVTPKQALAHPNWDMGAKISIDSATMMNKGLEIIEAHYLFSLPADKIEVVIHPQSIIHSLVSYRDGAILAQLGTPDMRVPIAYALTWPKRHPSGAPPFSLAQSKGLHFHPPDDSRFRALNLARQSLNAGGPATIIFNASNEVAVQAFLDGRCGFLDIVRLVEDGLDQCADRPAPGGLDDVLDLDRQARQTTEKAISMI